MAEIGKDINKAKRLLEAGELVAIPTETVYGLAGNALNTRAVASIFKVKNRPQFDPLIVHVFSAERAGELVVSFPEKARELLTRFWPGPLTIVLKKKEVIPDLVTSGLDTVGLRSPDHPLTRELLRNLDFPLAAPSANPFGYVSPTTPEHVNEQLGQQVSYILDGGPCAIGIESTIVGFENENVIVYRIGGLTIEQIESVAGPVRIRTHTDSMPQAPGRLASHYAPGKPLRLGDIGEMLKTVGTEKVGILSFIRTYNSVPGSNQIALSQSGNLDEAAQRLFSAMRELDKLDIKIILAEAVPDVGLGRAINDRLKRAASQV